jgi:ABC-type multidrug transport system fused ATPase/permease subunit
MTSIKDADNIVVLGMGGTVVEQGTHAELLGLHGHYESLWRQHIGEGSLVSVE